MVGFENLSGNYLEILKCYATRNAVAFFIDDDII